MKTIAPIHTFSPIDMAAPENFCALKGRPVRVCPMVVIINHRIITDNAILANSDSYSPYYGGILVDKRAISKDDRRPIISFNIDPSPHIDMFT